MAVLYEQKEKSLLGKSLGGCSIGEVQLFNIIGILFAVKCQQIFYQQCYTANFEMMCLCVCVKSYKLQ